MENTERKIIETIDEQGNTVNFELFDIIDYENKEYALLVPVNKENQDEVEIVLMKLISDGDDFVFEAIEDDEEFERVSEYVESMDDE